MHARKAHWIGAKVATNNTGELCAIIEATKWLLDLPVAVRSVEFRVDSKYALGALRDQDDSHLQRARKNRPCIERGRLLLRVLTATPRAKVLWTHVKSHAGERWNTRVDALAKLGTFVV